ncbi:MAG TPA: TetR/AcrR family transcriptional regulator [Rhizomicrobium sp.]|jgi:AcrR family transcriptional regulator|nr:TetR/AcrR family transcriptional regulator [Rhizomicrobium sp.]
MEQSEIVKPAAPRAVPAGKREQTKLQNRQIILEAARKVFAEAGYGATTVRDIIRATPLASGTFYNYFQSKEEVYQAMQDETALAIRPKLREAREKAGTVEEFISATFRTFFEFVLRDDVDVRTIRHNADAQRMRVDTPEVIAGFDELREDIEKGITAGLFPPVDADLLMAAIVGVAFELAEHIGRRENPDAGAAAEFATVLFMGGIHALPLIGGPGPAA